jgi:hypothetical protein
MIKKVINFMYAIRDRQRIIINLTKGATSMVARIIDLKKPQTWEFSGFSQNGEDGILDVLRNNLCRSNKYFIEIGSADGIDNNSAWLVIVAKYKGIMIDGNLTLINRAKRMVSQYSLGLKCIHMFVNKESAKEILNQSQFSDPDILSLDIDGNDYYIANALFDIGFRPKIFVVEYNSVFGPVDSKTIPYKDNFVFTEAHSSNLYYGVSITAWRKFFQEKGYKFVTVDNNGVNAFFVDPVHFEDKFLSNIASIDFVENQLQFFKFRQNFEGQYKLIENMDFVDV